MNWPLIGAAELAGNLGSCLVLEVGARKVGASGEEPLQLFQRGHLPGARFADLWQAFSCPQAPWPYQRPGASRFTLAAQALGVQARQRVVVYDRAGGIWAARLWWLFRAYGHEAVQVLDGGLDAWCATGLPLHSGEPAAAPPGDFIATPERSGFFVDREQVLAVVSGERAGQLLNVLRTPVFTGEELRYARRGHIPGSRHVPHASLLDPATGRLLPSPMLEQTFARLEPDLPVITYCGSGVTAAGTALALATVGRHNVAIYDGSLTEWAADPGLPLVTSRAR